MPITSVSQETRTDAHNLDDLFDRWRISHEENRLQGIIDEPRVWHQFTTPEEAAARMDEIRLEKTKTAALLAAMKGGRQWNRDEHKQRFALVAKVMYLDACIVFYKRILNRDKAKKPVGVRSMGELYHALITMLLQLHYWSAIYEFTDREYAVVEVLTDYLREYEEFSSDFEALLRANRDRVKEHIR